MNQAVYLGNRTVLTRTRYGQKIFVDADDIVLSPHIILDGDWESWVSEYFRRTLQRGMTFVDVGANCGWFTLLAASIVGDTGRVVAFDPNPHCAELLRKSLSINGYTRFASVVEAACGEHEGTVSFHIPKTGSGNGYVEHTIPAKRDRNRVLSDADRVVVKGGNVQIGDRNTQHIGGKIAQEQPPDQLSLARLVRLDDVLVDVNNGRLDVVKIDAEGFEPAVIKGMAKLIELNPQIEIVAEHHASNVLFFTELAMAGWRMDVIQHDSNTTPVFPEELKHVADSEMIRFTRSNVRP